MDVCCEKHPSGTIPSVTKIIYGFVNTFYGRVFVAKTPKGLCAFQLLAQPEDYHVKKLYKSWKGSFIRRDDKAFSDIDGVFNGNLSLNMHIVGTEFQIKVWQALLSVKRGQVVTYKELAQRAGCPKASRAVGKALNKNPIHILIPCHRVVKSDGSLGGYAGGIDIKAALLAYERK